MGQSGQAILHPEIARLERGVGTASHTGATKSFESALSFTGRVNVHATRWREVDMLQRWCAAPLLRAKGKVCEVKRHRAMPSHLKALESLTHARPARSDRDEVEQCQEKLLVHWSNPVRNLIIT